MHLSDSAQNVDLKMDTWFCTAAAKSVEIVNFSRRSWYVITHTEQIAVGILSGVASASLIRNGADRRVEFDAGDWIGPGLIPTVRIHAKSSLRIPFGDVYKGRFVHRSGELKPFGRSPSDGTRGRPDNIAIEDADTDPADK